MGIVPLLCHSFASAKNTTHLLTCTTVLLGAYLGVRLANAHSEYAHTVYKYAPNRLYMKKTEQMLRFFCIANCTLVFKLGVV